MTIPSPVIDRRRAMKTGKINTRKLILYAAAALLIVAALTAVGVSYARYRRSINSVGTLTMGYGYSSDSIHLLDQGKDGGVLNGTPVEGEDGKYNAPGSWSYVSSGNSIYEISFLLSNTVEKGKAAAFDQYGYLEVFVTEGMSGDVTIQLAADTGTYLATAETVAEGSAFYEAYGAGRIFRFKDKNGAPIGWLLPGGKDAFVPMTLTVWGTSADPAAVTLIATGTPSEK